MDISRAYDPNCNLTNDGKYTYTYNSENRLTAASMTGMSASYLYDPAAKNRGQDQLARIASPPFGSFLRRQSRWRFVR